MKKAALTIGLFSLAMVATSFTTPEIVSSNFVQKSNAGIDGEKNTGGMTGVGGRKLDNHLVNNQSIMKNSQSGFANVNQSLGGNKKLD